MKLVSYKNNVEFDLQQGTGCSKDQICKGKVIWVTGKSLNQQ